MVDELAVSMGEQHGRTGGVRGDAAPRQEPGLDAPFGCLEVQMLESVELRRRRGGHEVPREEDLPSDPIDEYHDGGACDTAAAMKSL